MAATKTKPTGASIAGYLASRASAEQLKDSKAIIAICRRVTKQPPKMWGPSLVGFGRYTYTYDSGHSGDMCLVGRAIRGKHKMGKVCLYIRRLADVDVRVLEEIVAASVTEIKRRYPTSA